MPAECTSAYPSPSPRMHALKVFAAHGLVAVVAEQALVASLRRLLAGVVEFALGFAVGKEALHVSFAGFT